MVIDSNHITGAGASRGRASTTAATAASSPAAPTTPNSPAKTADSVQLSSQAQTMSRIESGIKSSPDVDSAKVEAIKTAIAEGRFEINAEAIADKMLNQESLLG